jgi:hypothetical protein
LTAHRYIISFGVCSELLSQDGQQGPKHVGDCVYIYIYSQQSKNIFEEEVA